ncbi:hypothetical protein ACFQ3J_18985 [Paenibacillus provencensis]|uniref:Uncharacterized protein n=1 Tax=Paenibacillus provencensis TaxID=441151 RepID=A0ABW3PTM8_9BACL|nr:hypothetical protein [Paenibacillus sp. MER 78]MCM3129208.1 hypothetical protein [Paenibacillus sp. MER 78]
MNKILLSIAAVICIAVIVSPLHAANDSVGMNENKREVIDLENIKDEALESTLEDYPGYQREGFESRWVEVLDLKLSKEGRITVKDIETEEVLILREESEDLNELGKGERMIIVTRVVWMQSAPPQNDLLNYIRI